ncbi:hypothetical protein [uncultured Pseudomonas sp.]|uniref:hypothetical protein n=1 Tax=uncultured Pseudomonas sp. TaxID=114707 RepID=UPI0030DA0FD2|tara:strand:- start:3452 stop:3682 length:231 start_codon:yes stop_codon:yes gene_type:complete
MADESLKVSELERFARNLENFAKTNPGEAMYHRFYGILESQIATLQCCGVITRQGAVKMHQQMAEVVHTKHTPVAL